MLATGANTVKLCAMKFGFFSAAGALCAAAFLGCAGVEKPATYPIGVILPMGGIRAPASADILRGMELARDEINAAGGVCVFPVSLEVRDASAEGFSFNEEFDSMRRAGVKVFNLGYGREFITKKALVGKCDDVFVNFMCSYPPITLDMPNCTRIFINGAQEGDIMAKAVKRDGAADVQLVMMNVDDFFGKADADYLGFNLKVDKTKLYRDVFGEGESRFDVFSRQIMRFSSNYVFYVGYGSELRDFVESLARAGYGKTVVSNCGIAEESFTVPAGIKLYSVKTLFEQGRVSGGESKRFVSSYKAKYGVQPSWKSAYGYDSIRLLAAAAEKARLMPSKMRGYFKNLKYDGAIGKMEFDASADSLSELSLVER